MGFAITTALDITSAICSIVSTPPDAIFTAISLQEAAYFFSSRFRTLMKASSTPLIFLTRIALPEISDHARRLGAWSTLCAPIDAAALASAVEAALSTPHRLHPIPHAALSSHSHLQRIAG